MSRFTALSKNSMLTPNKGHQPRVCIGKDFKVAASEISNDSEKEQIDQVRLGAQELLEDIFGDKLADNYKTYTKQAALELAEFEGSNDSSKAKSGSLSSGGSSNNTNSLAERKMLVLELIDNIFQSEAALTKAQILEGICEQIKDDRYFDD